MIDERGKGRGWWDCGEEKKPRKGLVALTHVENYSKGGDYWRKKKGLINFITLLFISCGCSFDLLIDTLFALTVLLVKEIERWLG